MQASDGLLRCPLILRVGAVLVWLLVGCGGALPPEPAGPLPSLWCPLPLVWKDGEERPRGIRMTNATDARVSVWLDNCDGHTRLGDVPAGETFVLRLPNRLISFAGELRLYVYDKEARSLVGRYAVAVEPRWTLPLQVTTGTSTFRDFPARDQGRPASPPD